MQYAAVSKLPYGQKYWRELNLAVEPKIALQEYWRIKIWRFGTGSPYVDYMRVGNFGGFLFDDCNIDHQTAKFNSLPNFSAIQYVS